MLLRITVPNEGLNTNWMAAKEVGCHPVATPVCIRRAVQPELRQEYNVGHPGTNHLPHTPETVILETLEEVPMLPPVVPDRDVECQIESNQ